MVSRSRQNSVAIRDAWTLSASDERSCWAFTCASSFSQIVSANVAASSATTTVLAITTGRDANKSQPDEGRSTLLGNLAVRLAPTQ